MTQPFSRGFSLLEVLVAMSIFAIIGLGANQMLRTIIDSREATAGNSAAFQAVVLALAALDRDFSQVINREIRDAYGEPLPALMIGQGDYPVELTRAGWNNPLGRPRSSLVRVAYEVRDDQLVRHFWLVLDRAEDSEPITQVLLDDVSDIRLSVFDETGNSQNAFQDLDAGSGLPPAIEVVISSNPLGDIRRVYPLVASPLVTPATGVPGDTSGDAGGDDITAGTGALVPGADDG